MSPEGKRCCRICKAIPVGSLWFCGLGQEREWCRTSSDIARKITQKFEEASHPTFYCAEPFLKGDLKSKKGKETIHFQSTTRTKTSVIRFIFERNQLCIYASLIRTIKTKKLVIVKHQNFLKPTSRIHPKQRPTCFARAKDSKTIARVSQDAGFPAEVCKWHHFVTRPSIKREGKWSLVCRSNPDTNSESALF